ncbi:hypothetical protein AB0E96_03955 [Kitasatospora sp. NPDC036755]|uniref:hypothetical protein n=1 Tax=Kitasatospora sp. NPDC036755 TaxID=3154600 RepID=UPI0033EF9C55
MSNVGWAATAVAVMEEKAGLLRRALAQVSVVSREVTRLLKDADEVRRAYRRLVGDKPSR